MCAILLLYSHSDPLPFANVDHFRGGGDGDGGRDVYGALFNGKQKYKKDTHLGASISGFQC